MTMSRKHWGVAEAKAQFAELVQKSESAAQVVERHGKPVAVVVSFGDYVKAFGDPDQPQRAPKWARFLALSRGFRGASGHVLDVPKRTTRPDPFEPTLAASRRTKTAK